MSDTVTVQWSQLPKDLLNKIAKSLNTRLDNLRLRSICTSWRSSIPTFKNTPPLPLNLPFPVSPNPSLNPRRHGHFSLSQSSIYFLQPLHQTPLSNASKIWLLRVEETPHGKYHPLNPLSKILTENIPTAFPKSLNLLNLRVSEIGKAYSLQFVEVSKNIATTFGEFKSLLIKKAILSTSPCTENGDDYAVMAIHGGKLGFIKLGDEKWSLFEYPTQCDDVVYEKGKFYTVDHKGRLVVIGLDMNVKEVVPSFPGLGGGQFKYLVKSRGNIFLVEKFICAEAQFIYTEYGSDSEEINGEVNFKVYKLNEAGGKWEWVSSLGDEAFFVGDDCSYSVSVRDFPGLKGNCIYFSEDSFEGENEGLGELCPDTGVFSLEDGRCGPLSAFRGHKMIFWPPPTWLGQNPTSSPE